MPTIFVFLLFLLSGSLLEQTRIGFVCISASLVFMFFLLISGRESLSVDRGVLAYSALVCSVVLVNFIYIGNKEKVVDVIKVISVVLMMSVFFTYVTVSAIEDAIRRVAVILSVLAIFGLIYSGIMFGGVTSLPVSSARFAQESFCILGTVCFQQTYSFLGIDVWRQQTLFWEPAILSIYLCVAFLVCTFKSWGERALVTLGVLSTFSTTGYIFLAFVSGFMILGSRRIGPFGKMATFILCAPIVFILAASNYSDKTNIDDLNHGLQLETSAFKREADFYSALSAFYDNPVLGVGVFNSTYKGSEYSPYQDRMNTNGTLSLFSFFGIFGLVFVYPLLSRRVFLGLGLPVLFLYLSEPLTLSPGFFLFSMMALKKSREHRLRAP